MSAMNKPATQSSNASLKLSFVNGNGLTAFLRFMLGFRLFGVVASLAVSFNGVSFEDWGSFVIVSVLIYWFACVGVTFKEANQNHIDSVSHGQNTYDYKYDNTSRYPWN